MPTTMYAKVRRVLLVLWLVRNSESNTLTTNAIQRRTGLDTRTTRRILTMLHRLGLAVRTTPAGMPAAWYLTAAGITKARRIQDRYEATDNARRAAECVR